MSCCGDREKGHAKLEEKWDYVNLDDFKSESCWTPFSYFFLWIFLFVSLAVYGVDTFTAINLLAFSRWAGRIKPAIPFYISRWIFAACILFSFALLAYRWMNAIRAMRSGSITRSYMDPLAVRVQSFRIFGSKGRGWKRYLVFAELTKSKKGAEYVALYSYFSFHSWMTTVFADGPRQVLNGITLYSVAKMDLLPGGENAQKDDDASGFSQFFNNLKLMADDNVLQLVVLLGMLFTVIIWIISALRLASAIVLYLIYLFHHIPSEDGSLTRYCRRKISTRLKRIVQRKVDKALQKGFMLQERTPTQPSLATLDTKPTLPSFDQDKGPTVATISRSTTMTTLPPYTRSNSYATEQKPSLPNLESSYARSNSAAPEQNPTLPNLEGGFDFRPPLTRTTTQSSTYSETAPLTGHAAMMGYSPLDSQNSPAPPVPPLPASIQPPRSRGTPGPPPFANESGSSPGPGYRNLTDSSPGPGQYRPFSPATDPYASRSHTPGASISDDYFSRYENPNRYDAYGASVAAHGGEDDYYARSGTPMSQRSTPRPPAGPYQRSFTPASTGRTPPPMSTGPTARSMTPASYRGTPPPPSGGPAVQPPPRNFTSLSQSSTPGPQQGDSSGGGGGYAAYSPTSMGPPRPPPNRPIPAAPSGYQPFTRANTASPSAMNRNVNNGTPQGYGFTRANTDQF
ncbi:uncharacterized protein PFLUO_LOCUS3001 [Penicillium psychrofluorescens]|uniref:uncharacterized protein n=1 Tax=Penicillium psychrofluorescens TaxID=3158075 RepID=UPI003CCE1D2C